MVVVRQIEPVEKRKHGFIAKLHTNYGVAKGFITYNAIGGLVKHGYAVPPILKINDVNVTELKKVKGFLPGKRRLFKVDIAPRSPFAEAKQEVKTETQPETPKAEAQPEAPAKKGKGRGGDSKRQKRKAGAAA